MAICNDKKAMEEMILNGSMYLRNKTEGEKIRGEGMNAFDLSFAVEVLTGVPKEKALDMILDMQKKINEVEAEQAG